MHRAALVRELLIAALYNGTNDEVVKSCSYNDIPKAHVGIGHRSAYPNEEDPRWIQIFYHVVGDGLCLFRALFYAACEGDRVLMPIVRDQGRSCIGSLWVVLKKDRRCTALLEAIQ